MSKECIYTPYKGGLTKTLMPFVLRHPLNPTAAPAKRFMVSWTQVVT